MTDKTGRVDYETETVVLEAENDRYLDRPITYTHTTTPQPEHTPDQRTTVEYRVPRSHVSKSLLLHVFSNKIFTFRVFYMPGTRAMKSTK